MMNELIIYLLLALIFSVVGLFIGKLLTKLNFEKEKGNTQKEKATLEFEISKLNEKLKNEENKVEDYQSELKFIQKEKENLISDKTRLETELKNTSEKLVTNKNEVEKLQQKFTNDFEVLANKILEEKSSKFTQQNKENLKIILNPLQEKIKVFEDKVDKTHKESIDYHAALRQQILGLRELNQQMSKETINLTKALKGDNKMQGNWGELVLERVLEKSGLEKDREYILEKSFNVDNEHKRRLRPYVIINLPDNKKMIVDSKV